MERFTSIFDDEGMVVFDKWAVYKRKRDRNDDEEDEEGEKEQKQEVVKEKRPYAARNYQGYGHKLWSRNGTEDMYLESVGSKIKVNTPTSGDDSEYPTLNFKV